MAVTAVVLFALLLVVGGLLAYGVSIYNGLVAVKHQVDQAWSNIDVLLKQRHDELPKLIDSVKSYMTHERELLEKLTSLRARTETASADERMVAEGELTRSVAKLFAVAESYPQLRASEVFMDMQQRISALEEQIAHRREFYNAAVNINNVRMEQFPDVLLVSIAGMQRRTLFEVQVQDREDVDVGARLRS